MKDRKMSILIVLVILFNTLIASTSSFGINLKGDIQLGELNVETYEEGVDIFPNEEYVRVLVELKEQPILKDLGEKGLSYKKASMSVIENKERSILMNQELVKNDLKSDKIAIEYIDSFTTTFNGFSGKVKNSDLWRIENHPSVKVVYISQEYERPKTPQVDNLNSQSPPLLYSSNTDYNGESMIISIIDTGIDPNHKDMKITEEESVKLSKEDANSLMSSEQLPGIYYNTKVPYGYNYFDNNNIILDLGPYASGHGMHVAGIAGANGRIKGSAPEAQLLAMKVFSNNPGFPSTFEDIYIKAIEDSVKLGADVVNLSLGTPSGFYYEKSPIDNAVSLAMEGGVAFSISSGNTGHMTYGWNKDPFKENPDIGTVSFPSTIKDAISVGSSGIKLADDSVYMADFSSWGTTPNLEMKPEIIANGVDIYSTLQNDTYGSMSGTSMSSPYVAGAIARILQYINDKSGIEDLFEITPQEKIKLVKDLSMNTAAIIKDGWGQAYSPRRQGAGLINLDNAIKTPVILLESRTKESKIELRDFNNTYIDIDLEATNYSAEDIVYDIEVLVLGDVISNDDYQDYDRNILRSEEIEGVIIDKPDSITISGKDSENIRICIDFKDGLVPGTNEPIEGNMFIEGFIKLNSKNELYPDISIPYLGFFGEWGSENSPSIADGMDKFGYKSYYKASGMVDNEKRYLGYAPGIGYNGSYNRIAISPNTNSDIQGTMPVLSFMRNAEEVQYNILDQNNKIMRRLTTEKGIRKNYYNSGNGRITSYNIDRYWDGKVNNKIIDDGKYYYQIKAKVQGSNQWQEAIIPITVDTIAPETKVEYNNEEKVIRWTSTDEGIGLSYFKVFVDGKSIIPANQVVVAKEGQNTYEMPYDKPIYSDIEVIAYDYAGNYRTSKFNAIEDTEIPYVFVTSPEMFKALDTDTVNINGYIIDQSEILELTIDGEDVEFFYNQDKLQYDFSHTLHELDDGVHQVKINAIDINYNQIEYTIIFYVDTTKPILNIDDNRYSNSTLPLVIPGGGHTIILEAEAYNKDYLFKSDELVEKFNTAIREGQPIYVKLDNGIYINQNGELITELSMNQEIIYHHSNGVKAIYQSIDGEVRSILLDLEIGDNLGIFRLFINDSEVFIHEMDSILNLNPVIIRENFQVEVEKGVNEIILKVEDLAGNETIIQINPEVL